MRNCSFLYIFRAAAIVSLLALTACDMQSAKVVTDKRVALSLIPAPVRVDATPGFFVLREGAVLNVHSTNAEAVGVARYFADLLARTRGLHLDVRPFGGGDRKDGVAFIDRSEPARSRRRDRRRIRAHRFVRRHHRRRAHAARLVQWQRDVVATVDAKRFGATSAACRLRVHRRLSALCLARIDARFGAAFSVAGVRRKTDRRDGDPQTQCAALASYRRPRLATADQAISETHRNRRMAHTGACGGRSAAIWRFLHARSGARHRSLRRAALHHDRSGNRNARPRAGGDRGVSGARRHRKASAGLRRLGRAHVFVQRRRQLLSNFCRTC